MDVSTGGGRIKVDLEEPSELPFSESYTEGTIVAIEAIPSFGYVFRGWEKHITSTENPEFVTMDCNKYVTASFSVDWRFVGTGIGALVLIIFLIVVLIIRRRTPAKSTGKSR